MKKAVLYLAFCEDEQQELKQLEYDRSMSAQMFAEIHNIEFVLQVSDCSNLFWEAREGMKHILSEIEKQPEKVDCIVVYNYWNLIYEQKDFNALKRLLNELHIELVSITRGEIEVESDYYFE